MANPVSVKWFTSAMTGAPALSGTAGTLIGVLDACLIDGFGSVTLASLVVASGVATGTVNTGHGFTDHVVVLVAGATPSGLNGDKRITVTGANTFTFDATGISDQTASGTITAKVAPVGWTKAYSGTNKAAYARSDVTATAMLLRVDDTQSQAGRIIIYEAMTDIDTGTAPTPTSNYYVAGKSTTANSTVRSWALYADSRLFYLFINNGDGNYASGMIFGDIVPFYSADSYHCVIAGTTNVATYFHPLMAYDTGSCQLARSHTQLGTAVDAKKTGAPRNGYLSNGGSPFPNPVNNAIRAYPVECWEGNFTYARGLWPGVWALANAINSSCAGIHLYFNELSGRQLRYQYTEYGGYAGAPLLDLTGPWR